ncbi:MAG: endonuclease/exonuclease/phosphatase family protein [Lacunisphaera sp.]|jgi:endonuclease/exonuclease/phosphatase family metal-dependent hydrolase|nr:endonuclease/exonuclease/phosphatase family protein [Lacunisphaera sp.]
MSSSLYSPASKHATGSLDRRTFLKGLGAATALPWLAPRAAAVSVATPATHNIVTANIRVALPEDEATGNGWKGRRELCADVILRQKPDIICLQEVLREQASDLQASWPDHAMLGFAGPEMDAHATGYHGIAKNPIFYSRARYELTAAGGFWLSETPHLPGSLSWGTARARHVNWVRLKARDSGREMRVLSTHLDHQSQPAREKQMALILAEAALYPADFPQLLAGDLNARVDNPVCKLVAQAGWTDSYAEVRGAAGDGFTVHGFKGPAYERPDGRLPAGRIDFIFSRGAVQPTAAEIIRDGRDGRYPSDHYFVSAQIALT